MNATMTSTLLQQRAPAVAVGRQSNALAVRPVSVSTRKRFAAARASTENDSYQVRLAQDSTCLTCRTLCATLYRLFGPQAAMLYDLRSTKFIFFASKLPLIGTPFCAAHTVPTSSALLSCRSWRLLSAQSFLLEFKWARTSRTASQR